jgi:transcriptional regulator with XRE-family HTH domain
MNTRVYSQYTQDAVQLLGSLVTMARKEKKMTMAELAERAGISRGTLYKIEQGGLTSELGLVFEVAMIAGVKLFDMNPAEISSELARTQDRLVLLPSRVRHANEAFDDNF